jgi:hypothetical protein
MAGIKSKNKIATQSPGGTKLMTTKVAQTKLLTLNVLDALVANFATGLISNDELWTQLGSFYCTHPVPKNRFGVFAQHSRGNMPLSDDVCNIIFDKVFPELQDSLQADLDSVRVVEGED